MKIEFYGVRGSTPTPGENTAIFGGNTSCVHVQANEGNELILDAGTGIIALGAKLVRTSSPVCILFTHNHWDHIQGFPFFRPIYQKNRDILLIAGDVDNDDKDMILKQMSGSNHPVKYHELPANIVLNEQLAKQEMFSVAGFDITTMPLNHPDGGTAYCLHKDGFKVAYITDNELQPPETPRTSRNQWLKFIENADVVIHDGQYIEEDIPTKQGWGHSTQQQVAELALAAKVKQLWLISHDPSRTDQQLAEQEQFLQQHYSKQLKVTFAREGQVIHLTH